MRGSRCCQLMRRCFAPSLLPATILYLCTLSLARPSPAPGDANENKLNDEFINSTQALTEFQYGANGPATWFLMFKACAGHYQSPIDIDTVVSERVHQPHLFWWNYHVKPSAMTLTNNGHTVVLSGTWAPARTPYFWHATDDMEESSFVLDSIHFHWGAEDSEGSEHLINSVRFPLELHAVHHSKRLASLDNALQLNRGVAVVTIFFMISERHNEGLDSVVLALSEIENPSTVGVGVEPMEVGRLIPRFSRGYLTYNGSLTTPPCAEAVTWFIRLIPSHISKQQMAEFRKLKNHNGGLLDGNFRPIQPINGRHVRHVI